MSISEKDRDFMEEVAAFFRSTKTTIPEGSIRETASYFNITRTKVQKILVTTGDYTSLQVEEIMRLRSEGMSVKDISENMNISLGTVSSSLPYTVSFYGTADPTDHAAAVRGYRAYEKAQAERMKKERKGTKYEFLKDARESGYKTIFWEEKNMPEDWRKDLDSKLSFTETDSRRTRVTYEMIEESGMLERAKAALEAGGIEMPESYDCREELRKKESLTPDEVLDLGEFPGALYDRNPFDLAEIYGEDLPYEPSEMIRLHVELMADFSDSEKEIMHQYGTMEGDTISRDILVSDDLPLYALHYVIQRVFGFTNSHLHRFYLSDEQVEDFTESVEQWQHQVGVIFRSPFMDENAEFWADDYEGGSFKNWLRKKYTGPCVSQCWEEGLIGSRESMKWFDPDREYYVEYGNYRDDGEARPLRCMPAFDRNGKKYDPPKADKYIHKFRVEVVKACDIPVPLLNRMFERGAFDILERLPIGQVLALHNMYCSDDFQEGDEVSTYQEMLDDGMDEEIAEILESGLDSPEKQPYVYGFTDELFYQYDFGDNWQFRITGSRNCVDLVENGKITQDMLDKSNIKARVTYRPVLLSRDGEMLIDDVGGASGFAEFIRAINTMRRGAHDENGMTRTQLKEWAKSQGWHKYDSSDYTLL